jgi:iron complex transport system substrate-binding protein
MMGFTRFCAVALAIAWSLSAADLPQRIVSLSPDLTEILYGVGAFPRVVGVSNYDTYPPEVAKVAHLGQLHSPSLEKLTALRPDLVIVNNAQAPFLEDNLRELGLRVLKTSNRSVDEVCAAILTIGHATGNDREAAKLVATTREGLDRVRRRTSSRPRPRVVMIVNRTPGTLRDLSSATDGSYLADLVEIAGGQMAMPRVPSGYARLSKEDLLAANPDIILDFVHAPQSSLAGDPLEAWRELPELKAVREHRVVGIHEDYVPHASQRIVLTAELFTRIIHPESR